MQNIAHAASKRLIDHLMLLHAAFALERRRDDVGGPMVVIASKILEFDDGITIGGARLSMFARRRGMSRALLKVSGGSRGILRDVRD